MMDATRTKEKDMASHAHDYEIGDRVRVGNDSGTIVRVLRDGYGLLDGYKVLLDGECIPNHYDADELKPA